MAPRTWFPEVLTGSRVVLRRHVPENLAWFRQWYSDPEIARLARMLDEQRLAGATLLATTVVARLGDDDPARLAEVRDTIWTLNSPLLYGLLVVERGWSAERYGAWIDRALAALVL